MHYYYDPTNPSDPWQSYPPMPASDDPEDYSHAIRTAVIRILRCLGIFLAVVSLLGLATFLFSSCSSPKIIEQHHHHTYEADTIAVQAAVDARMTAWQDQNEQAFRQLINQEFSIWSTHSDQQETITELITVSSDSVGRTIRQEQRSITRSLSQQQQQMEQRITQEYEQRLRTIVDSLTAAWQSQLQVQQTHVAQTDSTTNTVTTSADTLPWYRRLLRRAEYRAFCIVIVMLACMVIFKKAKQKFTSPVIKNNGLH